MYRRSLQRTMSSHSASTPQEEMSTWSATSRSSLTTEFETRSAGSHAWVRFPEQQRRRALQVYLAAGALLSVSLCIVLFIAYPESGFSWFVFNLVPYSLAAALTARATRIPRPPSLASEVLGLVLGSAAVLCVGAAILWLSMNSFRPAEAILLFALAFLLVLVSFLIVLFIVRSGRSSGWSGQMRAVALYWSIIPVMAFFSLFSRMEHPAAIVAVLYCGFTATIWFGLRGVTAAARSAPKYRLLLLRSFPKQPQKTIIYPLINSWAHIGEVLMLAGPDLAKITLGPLELGQFLTKRIRRNFIQTEADLEKKLSLLDRPTYRDGRHHIHEFPCISDTWVQTFRRLMSLVDVVLIDLREFGSSHHGAILELEEIAAHEDMRQRTIVVTNDATNFELIDGIIPGALASAQLKGGPRIVRLGSGNDCKSDDLLRLLILAAEGSRPD